VSNQLPILNEESAAPAVARALAQVLDRPFVVGEGCYGTAGGLGLRAEPCLGGEGAESGAPRGEGASNRLLRIRLFTCLAAPPLNERERVAAQEMLKVLIEDLRDASAVTRAAACQRLGQLGLPDAETALRGIEQGDPEPWVQQRARQALEDLRTERIPPAALAGLRLVLVSEDGSFEPREGTTNEAGECVFPPLPMEAKCRLRLAVPAEAELNELVSQLVSSLESSLESEATGRHWKVLGTADSAGQMHIVVRSLSEEARTRKVELSRGKWRHQAALDLSAADKSRRVFDLPRGKCQPLFPEEPLFARRFEAALAAASAQGQTPGLSAEPGAPASFYIQAADRRLEPAQVSAHSGGIKVHLASLSPELGRARVAVSCAGVEDTATLVFESSLQCWVGEVFLGIPFALAQKAHLEFRIQHDA
jgi:hypothetical protein